MDFLSIAGIILALAAILGGQALEGGHAGSLMQLTAFIIVFGGTAGAVMVSFPKADFLRGLKLARIAFTDKPADLPKLIAQIVEMSAVARRDGVLALESRLSTVEDPFLKRAMNFLVDGVDASVARHSMEGSIEAEFEEDSMGAKVFEAAGGYCPTVGIIGAVLGLIHVMENLSNPEAIGPGIAVAFVATVYGVALANLLFLPLATKIKRKLTLERERKLLIVEGVLAIQEGLNPRVLEDKLSGLACQHGPAAKGQGKAPALKAA